MPDLNDFVIVRFDVAGKKHGGVDGSEGKSVTTFFENEIINVTSPDSHGVVSEYVPKSFAFRVGDIVKLYDNQKYKVIDVQVEYHPKGFNTVATEPIILLRTIIELQ